MLKKSILYWRGWLLPLIFQINLILFHQIQTQFDSPFDTNQKQFVRDVSVTIPILLGCERDSEITYILNYTKNPLIWCKTENINVYINNWIK